jgi:hypothetical protein
MVYRHAVVKPDGTVVGALSFSTFNEVFKSSRLKLRRQIEETISLAPLGTQEIPRCEGECAREEKV